MPPIVYSSSITPQNLPLGFISLASSHAAWSTKMSSPPRQQLPFPDPSIDQYATLFDLDPRIQLDLDPWAGTQTFHNEPQSATYPDTYCDPSVFCSVFPTSYDEVDWTTNVSNGWTPMPVVDGQSSLNNFGSLNTATVDQLVPWQGSNTSIVGIPAVRTDGHHQYPDLALPPIKTAEKSLPELTKGEHDTFLCNCPACTSSFHRSSELAKHESMHSVDHGLVRSESKIQCDECKKEFRSNSALSDHAKMEGHGAYRCKCNKTCTRLADFQRHIDRYSSKMPGYPCRHCKRHRGIAGFRREDHLMQHLQNYHHLELDTNSQWNEVRVCSHPECPQYRGPEFYLLAWQELIQQQPFAKSADFTRHMRTLHDESPFPCSVPHCSKIRGKGYFRERDLINHHKKAHPEAPPYSSPERQILYACQELNCDRARIQGYGSRESLIRHYQHSHGFSEVEAVQKTFEPIPTTGS